MTGKVLVVDDVPQNVKLLEAKLNSEYYTVKSCSSGMECLQKVKPFDPDIILLDVMMPEMDGFETCEKLKSDPETAHIPVVMVTALSEIEDRVHGLSAGATDFITKPIDEVHLFARVKSLIRLKMMLDELRLRDKTGSDLGLDNTDALTPESVVIGRILVIDDDIIQIRKINEALSERGNDVIGCDPDDAITTLESQPVDLIIISTMLDDHDGLRLAMEIRSKEQNRHVPIMILVDEDDKALLIKALEIGVDDYLMSPMEVNELIARVNTQIKRKRYQDMLKTSLQENLSAAVVDQLTKLYNRRYLDSHLHNLVEEALANKTPLSLMTLDIDHFKFINDKPGWGHAVGDEVLVEVANRIRNSIRAGDLATRPGGEEFVVVMPNTPLESAIEIAERTREAMANKPFTISAEPGNLTSTISAGVATLNLEDSDTAESLLKRSDAALYEAKAGGRNMVVKSGQFEAW